MYFDQEEPIAEILGLIADFDLSEPYELNAKAVFKAKRGYLLVEVSSCSCWPDMGSTHQQLFFRKSDLDRELTGEWCSLLEKCQQADWKVESVK